MHKIFFVLILLITTNIYLLAQSQRANRFSVIFEYKNKLDQSTRKDNNVESKNYIEKTEHVHTGSVIFTYKKNDRFSFETGYSFEPFVKGLDILTDIDQGTIHVLPTNYLITHSIPIRMVYNGIRTNVFKRVLSFEPAIGLTTCIRYNDGDIGGDGDGRLTGPALILVSKKRKGIEYNVRKVFFLLEARGQIKYELSTLKSTLTDTAANTRSKEHTTTTDV